MRTTHHQRDGLLRELDETACWERLRTRTVGRIAYVDHDGPIVVPLNYATQDGAIWVRTAPYDHLAVHVGGQRVAFEVDHADEHDHSGWSVLVRARAEHVLGEHLLRPPGWPDPAPWPDGLRSMVFCLTPFDITGRVLRQRDVSPAPGRGPGTIQRHTTGHAAPATST